MSIAMVDADEVTVEDGVVSFDDLDVDDNVNFLDDTNAEITAVRTDGTLVPGTAARFDNVAGGEIEFTVRASTDDDDEVLLHPIVFVADDGELPTDDGLPETDFGVGGLTTFADVDALATDPASYGADATNVVEVREGTTVEHVATLENTELADDVVPADGQTIDYRVVEAGDLAGAPDLSAGASVTDTWGSLTADVIAFSGSADTVDGEVTFEYEGGEAGDEWVVFVRWQGNDDYEDAATLFLEEDDAVALRWVDDEPEVAGLEFGAEETFEAVGGSTTVSVQAVDQFGDAYTPADDEDWQVLFLVDTRGNGDFTEVIELAADGSASFAYAGPAVDSAKDDITASLQDATDDTAITDPGGDAIDETADVWWYEMADATDAAAADLAVIEAADFDATLIILDITDDNGNFALNDVVAFDWTEADAFAIGGTATTQAAFAELLADIVDPDADPVPGEDSLETDNYQQDGTTVFNLY